MFLRIRIFFSLWGSNHYENRIDASLAWELAGIFADYADEISQWQELEV